MDEAAFNEKVEFVRRTYFASGTAVWEPPGRLFARFAYWLDPTEEVLRQLILGSQIDKNFWDAVNLIARSHIKRRDRLPDILASWVADVLLDQTAAKKEDKRRPRPAKGRRKGVRDQMIRAAVENMVAQKLTATRNGSPAAACARGGTACDVVGAAVHMNYKSIEGIWLSRRSRNRRPKKNPKSP